MEFFWIFCDIFHQEMKYGSLYLKFYQIKFS